MIKLDGILVCPDYDPLQFWDDYDFSGDKKAHIIIGLLDIFCIRGAYGFWGEYGQWEELPIPPRGYLFQ